MSFFWLVLIVAVATPLLLWVALAVAITIADLRRDE